ncbi:MAG: phage holin family protein, partial [Steroidobacteraceae bacterium]
TESEEPAMSANQFASGPRDEPLERESAAGLLSRLLADVTALFRNEVALAKAELAELTESAKAGIAAIAMAGVVLLMGLLALLAAAILGLAEVMAPWLAALIVGVVLAVAGLLLLRSASQKLQPSKYLDRVRTAVRHDAEVIARRT